MIRRFLGSSVALAVLASVFVAGEAQAFLTTWTIQSASSTLTIGGALSSGGGFLANVDPQGTNSLVGRYSGTIDTQQDIGPIATDGFSGTPLDIQFLSANLIALNNGNWDPLPGTGAEGTAPANYGANVSLGFLGGANLAIRGLLAGLSSGVAPLTGTAFGPQTFTNLNTTVTLTAATADYRGFGIVGGALGSGSLTSGIAGQSGAYVASGGITYGPGGLAGTATLNLPVNFAIALVVAGSDTTQVSDDIGVYLSLVGALVATSPTAQVPEASSLVMLAMAGSVVGFVGYRRKLRGNA